MGMTTRVHTFRYIQLLLSIALCSGQAACSDDCTAGATECVSSLLLRTCVPSDDGNQWLVSQCGPNDTCASQSSPARDDDDDAGSSQASTQPGQPACVGKCQLGEHSCVSDAVARVCIGEGGWQLQSCAVGQRCARGVCEASTGPGTVRACEPGTKACASERVAKVCDADGSGWVEQTCPGNQTCSDDSCQPNIDSACDQGNSCLDDKTAVHCAASGRGYVMERCEGDSQCSSGRCRGPVCISGTSCIADNQVRECIAGASYKDTPCGAGQVCQQLPDSASCVPAGCAQGVTACGDPRDDAVDRERFYTTCVTSLLTGIPQWVRGECDGASTCQTELLESGNPCSHTCKVGTQRCASDPVTGANEGIDECQADASWLPIERCNTGAGPLLECAIGNGLDTTSLPRAVCAEPVCAWIFENASEGATGSCVGDQLQRCTPEGKLADAAKCSSGSCRTVRNTETADGRMPGACVTDRECRDGETQCASSGDTATPRYRSCVDGRWSTELSTCDGDAPCQQRRDDQGLQQVLCGADCSPGARRCNDRGAVESCDATGHFTTGVACSVGECREFAPRDAACVLECMPNSVSCAGSPLIAADGYHSGRSQQIRCDGNGRAGAAENCPSGALCRVSDSGVTLGCVACIGPSAPGGNAEASSDSRCDPNDPSKLQECTDANAWADARACSGTKRCVAPEQGVCGTCVGGGSAMMTCSEALLSSDTPGTTCESLGYGAPGAWAGLTDCCATYQEGTATSFAYCQ